LCMPVLITFANAPSFADIHRLVGGYPARECVWAFMSVLLFTGTDRWSNLPGVFKTSWPAE
jgi:hypothetical protein